MTRRDQREYFKIAVVRANGIGDYVFALPALEALRARFPAAEIVLLGQTWHRDFLTGRPGPVDRVVVIPPCRGVSLDDRSATPDETELKRFFTAMRAERFDLAIQLHGGGRYSNPFVLRLGAGYTIGLKTPDAAPLDDWVPYVYFQPEAARYLEVVGLVGAAPVALDPRVRLLAIDEAELNALPLDGRPLALFHPGATDPRRHWPPGKFARVADALALRGLQVAVSGTAAERDLVEGVVGGMRHPALDLCGRLSLGALAALCARAAVVISNDSGPLHLAHAAGATSVGLYWCGNLINGGPLTRSRHYPVMSWRLHCPACGVNTLQVPCEHRESFVSDIPTDEVLAAALKLLERNFRGGRGVIRNTLAGYSHRTALAPRRGSPFSDGKK